MIGGADNFNGTSGYVSLPDLGTQTATTVEAFVNLGGIPADTYGSGHCLDRSVVGWRDLF